MIKLVREKLLDEGYGAGFSFTGGAIKGMGGTSRGGFGGANNLGGPNMMYTYEIKPLNHTLEQLPTVDSTSQVETIQLGSKISGLAIRSNSTPSKKPVTGIVQDIKQADDGAIMYYVVRDEDTQKLVRLDPLSSEIIIHEPVEYYTGSTENLPSRRKEKMKERKKIVKESLYE